MEQVQELVGALHSLTVNQAIEDYLAAKRMKTDQKQEVENPVEVAVLVKDLDRSSSPLTELSPLSSVLPLTGAPLRP